MRSKSVARPRLGSVSLPGWTGPKVSQHLYLSPIPKCICRKLQNVFVSNSNMYLSQIPKCICLQLPNVFVSNSKMYLSQIPKCICLIFQNVFVWYLISGQWVQQQSLRQRSLLRRRTFMEWSGGLIAFSCFSLLGWLLFGIFFLKILLCWHLFQQGSREENAAEKENGGEVFSYILLSYSFHIPFISFILFSYSFHISFIFLRYSFPYSYHILFIFL